MISGSVADSVAVDWLPCGIAPMDTDMLTATDANAGALCRSRVRH